MEESTPSPSLREPLLGPEATTEDASYWVQFEDQYEDSAGLEDAMRTWYDQRDMGQNDESEGDEEEMHQSERPGLPWYRNPLQIMAMISNFSTSYNVVNISLVLPILKIVLHETNPVRAEDESMLASSLLGGMVAGQLIGGALGDSFLGLTGALTLVMILQLIASLGSATVSVHDHDFCWTLAAWRLVLGIGSGAVYPLAACLSVEQGAPSSCKDHEALRVKRVVWTFAMQGLGFWTVPFLATVLVYTKISLELIWRILLAAGCLPGMALLFLQYRVLFYQPPGDDLETHLIGGTQISPDPEQEEPNETTEARIDSAVLADEVINQCEQQDRAESASVSRLQSEARSGNIELGGFAQSTESCTKQDIEAKPSQNEDSLAMNQPSERTQQSRHVEEDATGMADRDLHDDSDGEVGTFLDSSPDMDMSSAGVFRESEPPVISAGWLVSLQTEERIGRKLLGTAVTWFLFDVLFYGNTLFQPIVIERVFGSREALVADDLIRRVVCDSLVLNSIALPGYIVAAILIGKKTCGIQQSPRYVMMQGFAGMALLYLAIGLLWRPLLHFPICLVFLYGLSFFFANYGPNTTTFILPSLVYSAECRSTFNGLSAACGKLGALVGASVFAPLDREFNEEVIMLMCAGTALVALVMTALFVRLRATPSHTSRPGRGRYSVVHESSLGTD